MLSEQPSWPPVAGQWSRIASGEQEMPEEFQRFIAAWELIVLWHRKLNPEDERDSTLFTRLGVEARSLGLEDDPDWRALIQLFSRWTILRMSGTHDTGQRVRIAGPTDLDNVVQALYTVRCNLIKGGKQPNNQNDRALAGEAATVALFLAKRLWGRT